MKYNYRNLSIYYYFFFYFKFSILTCIFINYFIYIFNYKLIRKKYLNFTNKYSLNKDAKIITNQAQQDIFFNFSNVDYSFSLKFKIVKIRYSIFFFDQNNNLIKPTNLSFLYGINIICNIKELKTGITIDSISNINKNINFVCVEYIKINEPIEFGIKLYKKQDMIEYCILYFFNDRIFKYNKMRNRNNKIFNILLIINKYNKFIKDIKNSSDYTNNNSYKLKKSYISPPIPFIKNELAIIDNQWVFYNIYSNYFCFCKGILCLENTQYLYQYCKYRFYLTIIDNNKNLYKKTDYLFIDFIIKDIEPIDGYPIFKEMIIKNLSAHYMTKDEKIYNESLLNKNNYFINNCPIIYEKQINGDFLEKYLETILKLKVVIGVDNFYSIDNLFYNIEYITYIFLGHGVSYFKQYLYNDYLNFKKYNKILIPPSKKLISIAKMYGWKDKDIIKIGLPRWDFLNIKDRNFYFINNKSIFLMFTWRSLKIGKTLSDFYINNTINLLKNIKLNKILNKRNISFFFTYHHNLKGKKKLN